MTLGDVIRNLGRRVGKAYTRDGSDEISRKEFMGDLGIYLLSLGAAAKGGMAAASMLAPTDAHADSTTTYHDRQGREIGHKRHIETGPEPSYPTHVPSGTDKYVGRDWREVMDAGKEAYGNGNYNEAYSAFMHVATEGNPGNVEGRVWFIKSLYQKENRESGRSEALRLANGSLDLHIKNFGNGVFKTMKKRLNNNDHFDEFSGDGYMRYLDGVALFKAGKYESASRNLRLSVEADPYNKSAWNELAYSEFHRNGKNKLAAVRIWKDGVQYHPSFQRQINKFSN